jgi:DNA-binding transcriptional LysR family regulator
MKKRRLSPSLEYLELYCRIFEVLNHRHASLHQIAKALKVPVSNVWNCLKYLERRYKVPFVTRVPNKNENALTTAGRSFYGVAKKLIDDHKTIADWPQAVMPEIRVATTNTILVHLLPTPVTRYLDEVRSAEGKVHLVIREYDWPEILDGVKKGEIHFGLGPALPGMKYPGVELKELDFEADVVLVCSPHHRFAREKRKSLKLKELTSESMFHVPVDVQPGLESKLVETGLIASDAQTEVSSYNAILAHVSMGTNHVGLVPGWYPVLDDLRKRGLIYYITMPELGKIRLALYLRKGGGGSNPELPERASQLLASLEKYLDEFKFHPAEWEPEKRRAPLPPVEGAWFAYHVTCDVAGFTAPRWVAGKVRLHESGKGQITGHEDDQDEKGHVLRSYKLYGRRGEYSLYWSGNRVEKGKSPIPDCYVTTLNTVASDGSLVGIWTGFDESVPVRQPLSGTVILSRRKLDVAELQETAGRATIRFMLNADWILEE